MFTNRFILNTDPDKITLIGDSAGGNLAAAVSLMARDQGEFLPKRIPRICQSDAMEQSIF